MLDSSRLRAPAGARKCADPAATRFAPAWTGLLLAAAFLLLYRLGQVPPGLHVDAAIDALDAQRVLNGHFAIFFDTNNGREPLYMYYLAGLIGLSGAHRLVYDFAPAAMGMLTVALSCRLVKAMFGPLTGVLAAALLGTSFWALYVDRIGQRVTMLAPATVALLYFLWRTLRQGRRRDALLSGGCLGLGLYIYQPGRFLPLLALLLCLADWQSARKRAGLLALTAVVAVVIFLPEAGYFAAHPSVALQRTAQVSVLSSDPVASLRALGDSAGRTAGMFFVEGDWRPWQNLPFRPVFDPLLAALFCFGLLLAIVRCRTDVRYGWLLLWLVIMALPGVLTTGAPNQFRLLGSMPVAFVFPAVALVFVAARLHLRRTWAILAVALIGLQGARTYDAYFRRWGPSQPALAAFDGHETAMAAAAEANPGVRIYFSDIRTLAGQPVRALVPAAQQQPWYPEDSAYVPVSLAAAGDTLYVGSPRSSIGTLAPESLPGVQILSSSYADSHQSAWIFRWPAAERERLVGSLTRMDSVFGTDMRLAGYAASRQSSFAALDLFWQQIAPSGPYDLYTHVLDSGGRQVAQGDKLFFPVELLGLAERFGQGQPAGDVILTRYSYALPPGRYTVEAGVVHRLPSDLGQLLNPAGPPVRFEVDL